MMRKSANDCNDTDMIRERKNEKILCSIRMSISSLETHRCSQALEVTMTQYQTIVKQATTANVGTIQNDYSIEEDVDKRRIWNTTDRIY